GNEKFDSPIRISSPLSASLTQFSTITCDEKQDLHIMYMELYKNKEMLLLHSKSTDQGKTFNNVSYVSSLTMPKSILDQSGTNDTIVGITSRRLYPAPLIVADNKPTSRYKNNLYAVWNANGVSKNEGKKMDIYFSRSTDGGNRWEKAKVLNRENNSRPVSQYYPSLAVNNKGVIAISYYDRNDDVNFDIHTDYVIQFSYDGGISFTEPRKMNNLPTDFRDVGVNNTNFGIGEYNMLIFQDEQAIPVWADGREGDGKVRIYTTRTNQDTNGIEVLYSLESTNRITNAYFENLSVLIIEKLFTKESSYH
ncbi:MAG: sialidase family protein, partial [Candidatus Kapaibacterium sp.]